MSDGALKEILRMIRDKLRLNAEDHILEVGCGAGMILKPLSRFCRVAGIDYSNSLIEIIRETIPEGTFVCCEADDLPFDDGYFNKALSFSVFQYFDSLSYAGRTIDEMIRCTKEDGLILICDVPDLSKRQAYEEERDKHETRGDFEAEMSHIFYPRGFFKDFCKERDIRCKIFNLHIEGYENSRFRMNVLVNKRLDYLDPIEWYWR
ncbi:hypothetical protein ES703_68094 [subsurface metagenome]